MFNVGNYILGVDGIKPYMHTLEGRVPETVARQERLLRKWNQNKGELYSNQNLPHDEISQRQLRTISMLVDNAYSTHPFYHELYKKAGFCRGDIISWNDYNALPSISKTDIIDNYTLFTSNLGPSIAECGSPRTSGSSGRAIQVLRDPTMIDAHTLQEMRFFEQILGRERKASDWLYLVYVDCPPFTSLNGQFPTFTISNDCPPDLAVEHIIKLKPKILSGFATYFNRMMAHVNDPSILGIEAITTNSETSTIAERKLIGEKLGAPVFDEYSSIELGYIATECKEHSYHIAEDNVRVDVLNPDANGVGEIVATNLVNTYWPMIRYRQGDPIKIGSPFNQCACGNRFRQLDMFVGRADQFLKSRISGVVPADRVMALYDRLLLPPEACIDEFRIIQTKPEEIKLLLVPMKGHNKANEVALQQFVRGLKELFQDPGLNILIEQCEVLPALLSHKRRLIENRIA